MTSELAIEELDLSLLKGGPLFGLLVNARIVKEGMAGVIARIAFFIGLTWIPVVALCIIQGISEHTNLLQLFLLNFAESVRFLLVVPLLIFAELHIQPWLNHVIRYFIQGGLISDEQLPKFSEFVRHAQRMRDSAVVELVILLLAFGTGALGLSLASKPDNIPWLLSGGKLTLPGMWYQYIAIPMCRFLWLRWLWRIVIWWSFLSRVSTLKLKLVPTHPDYQGGLGFLAAGHNNFSVLWFAFSVQFSSVLAQEIIYHGVTLNELKGTIALYVVLMVLFSVLPLLVFTPNLLDCRRKGLYEYGILAKHYVDFHATIMTGKQLDHDRALAAADANFVSQVPSNFQIVRNMNIIAFGKSTLVTFLLAVTLPLCPLVLTLYPIDALLDELARKLIN